MVEEARQAEDVGDIGPYQILRRLGRGGMAEVYVGRHRLIGRTVAIKVLLEEHARDPKMRARFLNEARAVASIQHPNVVMLYEIGQSDAGDAFLAMELLEGETLSARLRRDRTLAPWEAVEVAGEIADALIAAHARQVVHRDLKPSNVMLVPDSAGRERVKVLDFGIAKVFEATDSMSGDLTRTGAVVGTPTYMSPEQCRGFGEVDHRTDIYSLGVVLYRMVTGRPPFHSRGAGEVIGMHLYLPAQPPRALVPELPVELDRFIMRCLEKHPDDRFQTMDELAAALAEVANAVEHSPRSLALPPAPELPTAIHTVVGDRSEVREIALESDPGTEAPSGSMRRGLLAVLVLAAAAGALAGYLVFGRGVGSLAGAPATSPVESAPEESVSAPEESAPVPPAVTPTIEPIAQESVAAPVAAVAADAGAEQTAAEDAVAEPDEAEETPAEEPAAEPAPKRASSRKRTSPAKRTSPEPKRRPARTPKPPEEQPEAPDPHDFEKPVF